MIASKTVTAAQARRELREMPVLSFFIYPEGKRSVVHGKNAFWVRVFRSERQLRKQRKLCWPRRKDVPVWAFTKEYRRKGKFLIGSINLYLGSATDNIVSHEMWHATMWWAKRMEFDPAQMVLWKSRAHERMAEAHGNLVSQFWKHFTRAGFPRKECWGFIPPAKS